MKKFLLFSLICALFVATFGVTAEAYLVYVNLSSDRVSGAESSDLVLLSKDSSGEIINTKVKSLDASPTIFTFKHDGENKILVAEMQSDETLQPIKNIVSIYDLADLTKPVASVDVSQHNLVQVTSVAEFGDNIILAGIGSAILEINPDTCEIVNKYEFGSDNNDAPKIGDIDLRASVVVHDGKIYATFSQFQTNGFCYFPVVAETLSDLPTNLSYTGNFATDYEFRVVNENLYAMITSGDDSGLYKVNSLTDLEKIIPEQIQDFDSDGGDGFFYIVSATDGTMPRYLRHWNGTTSTDIYDVNTEKPSDADYAQLRLVKYDEDLNTVFLSRIYTFNVLKDRQNYHRESSLLALSPSDGSVLKEISVDTITSVAVIKTAKPEDGDNENKDGEKTDDNSSGDNDEDGNNNDTTDTIETGTLTAPSDSTIRALSEKSTEITAKLGTLADIYPFKPLATTTTTGSAPTITNAQLKSALGSSSTFSKAVSLPIQTVAEAGTYVLGTVSLKNYIGKEIVLVLLTGNATSGYTLASEKKVELAEEVSKGAFFTDAEGKIITEVPSSGEAIAIAPMARGVEYTPVVTLSDSSSSTTNKNTVGKSGSGCEAGLGVAALAILAFAFFKKR